MLRQSYAVLVARSYYFELKMQLLNTVATASIADSFIGKSVKIRAKIDFLQTHLFFVISVCKCQGQDIIEYFQHIKPKNCKLFVII
jgi:hypothetical protein